jgi:hypothetical protein
MSDQNAKAENIYSSRLLTLTQQNTCRCRVLATLRCMAQIQYSENKTGEAISETLCDKIPCFPCIQLMDAVGPQRFLAEFVPAQRPEIYWTMLPGAVLAFVLFVSTAPFNTTRGFSQKNKPIAGTMAKAVIQKYGA